MKSLTGCSCSMYQNIAARISKSATYPTKWYLNDNIRSDRCSPDVLAYHKVSGIPVTNRTPHNELKFTGRPSRSTIGWTFCYNGHNINAVSIYITFEVNWLFTGQSGWFGISSVQLRHWELHWQLWTSQDWGFSQEGVRKWCRCIWRRRRRYVGRWENWGADVRSSFTNDIRVHLKYFPFILLQALTKV